MTDRSEYFRAYYLKHKTELNSKMRLHFNEDRDLQRARCQEYRTKNAEVISEYQKQYRTKNRERTLAKNAELNQQIEYKIARAFRRKYGISLPIPLIREIRQYEVQI